MGINVIESAMSGALKFLVFWMSMALGASRAVLAAVPCSNCWDEVPDQALIQHQALECPNGHRIDQECLTGQALAVVDLNAFVKHGLPCSAGCGYKFSLAEVKAHLSDASRQSLEERVAQAEKPEDESIRLREVGNLRKAMDEAFNFCCPIDGCGSTLDQIEGCNAATCSNEECQQKFCYLCLEPQKDNASTHAHVKEHSGEYWEHRPGYAQRYKQLLIRKNLAAAFKRKVTDDVRAEVLESRKEMLQAENLWPMPAGRLSSEWIKEVDAAALSHEKKVELLQNEFIFRKQSKDLKNAELIEAELRRMGALVLASLDVKDAAGVYFTPFPFEGPPAGMIPPPRLGYLLRLDPHSPEPEIQQHLIELSNRFPRFFDLGGPQGLLFEVSDPAHLLRPYILSGNVGRMTYSQAIQFCAHAGAYVPSREQLNMLVSAMSPGWIYDRNSVPGISESSTWSREAHAHFPDFAWLLNGYYGVISTSLKTELRDVRCVFPLRY